MTIGVDCGLEDGEVRLCVREGMTKWYGIVWTLKLVRILAANADVRRVVEHLIAVGTRLAQPQRARSQCWSTKRQSSLRLLKG